MEQRLVQIEEQIAHLERAIETLDEVVREAFDAIAQLRRDMERMGDSTRTRLDGIIDVLDKADDS